MNFFAGDDFNIIYKDMIQKLYYNFDYEIINRKGTTLRELTGTTIKLNNVDNCYAYCRDLNYRYLVGELLFYLKCENKLKNISMYSKFWEKCSDNGVDLNSCYGYYIWNQKTKENISQFNYCYNQLIKNSYSKKAVMTIYTGSEHSKKTNDNPCTMFMQFTIRKNKLDLYVFMRSNDIYFGLPYDIPFFIFVMKMMKQKLKNHYTELQLGSYIHNATSLHLYEKDFGKVSKIVNNTTNYGIPNIDDDFFNYVEDYKQIEFKDYKNINHEFIKWSKEMLENKEEKSINKIFDCLKEEAIKNSTCLKKKVACMIETTEGEKFFGFNGRPDAMTPCKECVAKKENFFHDTCNSLHCEERAILSASSQNKLVKLKNSTIYITHGPCDQCLKFLIETGVKKVVYEIPYKTEYDRYKGIIEIYEMDKKLI